MTDPSQLTSPGDLSLNLERVGPTLTVSVVGEIDMSNCDALDAALTAALDGDAEQVVLDLRSVDFIDSSGLRVLLDAGRLSEGERNRLTVHQGTGNVARLLRVTAIDQTLRVLD